MATECEALTKCDSCGEQEPRCSPCFPDAIRSEVCARCWRIDETVGALYERIRSRRAAKEPAVVDGRSRVDRTDWSCGCIEWPSQEFRYRCGLGASCGRNIAAPADVLDADGRPVKVGDRVNLWADSEPTPGTVHAVSTDVDMDTCDGLHGPFVHVTRDDGTPGCGDNGTWLQAASLVRHLPPAGEARQIPNTSAPTGPADPPLCKPEECDLGYTRSVSGRCDGCGAKHEPRKAQPPGPSLSAFTDAVRLHLEPRLPEGFRCVTDAVTGYRFGLWIFDGDRQIFASRFDEPLTDLDADGIARYIAVTLLSRSARVQPDAPSPPRKSFEELYRKGAGS